MSGLGQRRLAAGFRPSDFQDVCTQGIAAGLEALEFQKMVSLVRQGLRVWLCAFPGMKLCRCRCTTSYESSSVAESVFI